MASRISVPCPKCSAPPRRGWQHLTSRRPMVSFPIPWVRMFQGTNWNKSLVLKAQAHKVASEGSNSTPMSSTNSNAEPSSDKDADQPEISASKTPLSEASISAFIAEALDLVKLVDSRDITELQLKQKDFEIIIRKKEAMPQPAPSAPYVMMQPPQAGFPAQSSWPHAAPPPMPASAPPSAPALALPPPAKASKSSLPPLKCPMAGTFYRSPAPGEPPFVKVGDKVQKGQAICIIEAMKLMNSIEADQSGTVVEIIAQDGQAVSIDTPLMVIQP